MIAFVLFVLSAIAFLLKVLGIELDDLDTLALGLFFMAAAFCAWLYWGSWRTGRAP
jgi:hypothetical protein